MDGPRQYTTRSGRTINAPQTQKFSGREYTEDEGEQVESNPSDDAASGSADDVGDTEVPDNDTEPDVTEAEAEKSESDEQKEKLSNKKSVGKPQSKATTKQKSTKTKLRDGVKVTEEEIAEAAVYLEPLPALYTWELGPRVNLKAKEFTPYEKNSPETTPNFEGRSVTSIFLEMVEEPLQEVIRCTNIFGLKKFRRHWKPMTWPYLLVFLAALFYMDENPRQDVVDYWKKKRPDRFMNSLRLSRKRYRMYLTAIRLYDPADYSQAEAAKNKVYKAENFIDMLVVRFQQMKHPGSKHLSLDEQHPVS